MGMAKVFDFLHATNEVLTERGVELPLPGPVDDHGGDAPREGSGGPDAVVGAERDRRALRRRAPDDQQHIQRFLSANCFGDHLTRTGLDMPHPRAAHRLDARLARRCRPAGQGHVAANLQRRQRPRDACSTVLTHLLPFIGYPRTLNGLQAINEVAPAAAGE